MPANLNFLNVARVNGIMMGLQDPRTVPQDLVWLGRTQVVPALDEEVLARFYGQVLAADLIADDQKAATYSQGRFQFETNKIPNLKIGVGINQAMLNVLHRMQQGYSSPNDSGIFSNWENRTMTQILTGVRQRMESLIVAMMCDNLNYSRLGIKITNATWGMFSDLKQTNVGAATWDQAGTATPVNDLLGLKLIAKVRYGIIYDRVTMSTQAFRYMIATTEFQNKAKNIFPANVTVGNIPAADLDTQQKIAVAVLGMEVELYDARFWAQDEYGVISQAPYLPISNVLLTSKSNDNNRMAWDFANAIVTETIVAQLAGSSIIGGAFSGPSYGPVSYVTPTSIDLNSPAITYWGVARGFPRKHLQSASSCLIAGAFTDAITVGIPVPQ